MKILIDMNLSPSWISVFAAEGWTAKHWSMVGNPAATDKMIIDWARENGYIVMTHDLDFGILLALTREKGPSVVQIRTQNIMPESLGVRLISILEEHKVELEQGVLMTIDPIKARIRILPIKPETTS